MDSTTTSDRRTHSGAIFLSPHLDDAVLSCGGTIHRFVQAGKPVLVVSVMAGDPPQGDLSTFAKSLHARWQLPDNTVAMRRAEDIEALVDLGADWLHWPIPDCIYRQNDASGEFLYASENAIFGSIDSYEKDLIGTLSRYLDALPHFDSVFVPLAAGEHVDHRITRLAAERWFGPASIVYYEEYPYSQSENQLATALGDLGEWCLQIVNLTQEDIEARIGAISRYRSQLSTFFDDLADMAFQVRGYNRVVGGERFWTVSGRESGLNNVVGFT
jgi:LmbE family N-acetylglucosaminyl deacetylase